MMQRRTFLRATALAASSLALGCQGATNRVVLYCAQDREFAESILADFSKRTGVDVAAKYDTEADKSVSLYEELLREKGRPRCDVHWNNEILATIRLRRQGLLQSYKSPASAAFPEWAHALDHTWHAFAARARVLLVNTKLVREPDWPRNLLDLTQSRWKGRVAMAKPLFGTTATQAACLYEVLGPNAAEQFYRDLVKNDVRIVPGNKQAAQAVSRGDVAVGLTDTDDAIIEVKAEQPVAIVFPDREKDISQPRMGTLFIPNTLALVAGGPNADGGGKLIDFLLSTEVEAKLAENDSHQIPLNPAVKANLPREILTPRQAHPMAVDFEKAADLWDRVQTFLRTEFARA